MEGILIVIVLMLLRIGLPLAALLMIGEALKQRRRTHMTSRGV